MATCPSHQEHTVSIAELKLVQDIHTKSIDTLTVSLDRISTSFMQIKWLAYGGASLYILSTIGFVDFVKGIF